MSDVVKGQKRLRETIRRGFWGSTAEFLIEWLDRLIKPFDKVPRHTQAHVWGQENVTEGTHGEMVASCYRPVLEAGAQRRSSRWLLPSSAS